MATVVDTTTPSTEQLDLQCLLMRLYDEEAYRLRGLICAAYGLSEAILSNAEDTDSVDPAIFGLRQVTTEAESLIVELMDKLDTARELAREAPHA